MPSFILIRPTVWLQYTNVTDRQRGQTGQRTDSIGRTALQTVAEKRFRVPGFGTGSGMLEPVPWSRLLRQITTKKRQKLGGLQPEGDSINRSRRNLAPKRIPSVCSSAINLAVIGKRGRSSPQVAEFVQTCAFGHRKPTQWTHVDKIWFVIVDLGSAPVSLHRL